MNYTERYGFDKEFGLLDMSILRDMSIIESDDMVKRLSKMSNDYYKETIETLKESYDLVEALAVKLLEFETLQGEEIELMLNRVIEGRQ